MQKLLEDLVKNNIEITKKGNVANYIPELDKARKDALGICIIDNDENVYFAGDYEEKFTIQSISKIITLMLAIMDNGEEYVFSKVGMEPSGDPFNSIKKLETSSNKPFNPMINAGAIAVASMIKGKDAKEKINRILDFTRLITEDDSIDINYKIYCGENETGNKNRGMAYYLKNDGIIEGNVEEALEVYFKQCSINANTYNLAKLGLFLANDGKTAKKEQIIAPKIAKIVKSLMITCGSYDMSGEVAVRVGLPCKSGVGGGIVSLVPNRFGIGVFGPSLDTKGNSIGGIAMLEGLSSELSLSIF